MKNWEQLIALVGIILFALCSRGLYAQKVNVDINLNVNHI